MKEVGVFTIDEMGRILIPAELRSMLGWEIGDKISMHYTDAGKAVLQSVIDHANRICDICEEGKAKA